MKYNNKYDYRIFLEECFIAAFKQIDLRVMESGVKVFITRAVVISQKPRTETMDTIVMALKIGFNSQASHTEWVRALTRTRSEIQGYVV